jgi:hypothetical protein
MLGSRVISELTSVIPASQSQNDTLFFDKFFISVDILTMLKMRNLKATGAVKETWTSQCPLIPTGDMEKQKNRCLCDYPFDKVNTILVVKCKGNKVVTIGPNFSTLIL